MAKKNKKKGQTKPKQQVDVSVAQVEEQTEQNEVVVGTPKETETKQADKSKPEKKTDKKKNKVKKPSKTAKKIKETTSELKKVTWPSFLTVVKKTGVVLAVVIIFAVVLFGIDRLLSWLFELLTTSVA